MRKVAGSVDGGDGSGVSADAGSGSSVAGSGFSGIRAIQHYLVQPSFGPQGQKSGLFRPKAGSFGQKPASGFTLVPVCSRPAGRPAGRLDTVPLEFPYCFSGAGCKPAGTREYTEYTGIPGNTGNKARRAVLGQKKPAFGQQKPAPFGQK